MKKINFLTITLVLFLLACGNGEDHTGIAINYVNLSDHEVTLRAFNYIDEQTSSLEADIIFPITENASLIWHTEYDGKDEKLNSYSFLYRLGDSVYIDFDNSKRLIFRARIDDSGRSVFNEENYEKTFRTYKSGVFHTLTYTITNEDYEDALLIE